MLPLWRLTDADKYFLIKEEEEKEEEEEEEEEEEDGGGMWKIKQRWQGQSKGEKYGI